MGRNKTPATAKRPIILTIPSCGLWVLCVALFCASAQTQELPHPMQPADLLRYEQIEDFHLSPDGNWLAYVRSRPLEESKAHLASDDGSLARGDIWLMEVATGRVRKLTDGRSAETGYSQPKWSPDGKRIAILALQGNNLHLVIWRMLDGTLTKLPDRNVSIGASAHGETSCEWMGNEKIACALMPIGQATDLRRDERAEEYLTTQWELSRAGSQPSVSELDSGMKQRLSDQTKIDLDIIDTQGKVINGLSVLGTYSMAGSLDGRSLAFIERVDVAGPTGTKRLDLSVNDGYSNYVVSVMDDKGQRSSPHLIGPRNPEPTSLRWSPTGEEFVVSERDHGKLYRCIPSKDKCELLSTGQISGEISEQHWTESGEELLFIESSSGSVRRGDWWLFPRNGSGLNLTAGSEIVPRSLVRIAGENSFVGIANGGLYRLSISDRRVEPVNTPIKATNLSIIWPKTDETVGAGVIVVSSEEAKQDEGDSPELYVVDLNSGRTAAIPKLASNAQFLSYSAGLNTGVFRSDSDEYGTRVFSCSLQNKCRMVSEADTFLRKIERGRAKMIQYTSLNGKTLTGWVLLPPGYKEGAKYPTVLRVYEGLEYSPSSNPFDSSGPPYAEEMMNAQVLAGHGYVVLLPSMPASCGIGEICDPYFDLLDGVLPAIQKVVDLGITDDNRIGVLGMSYGGYSTYGLVTLTDRFKVAISLEGPSDFSSLYGSFSPQTNYSPAISDLLTFNMFLIERHIMRMGSPPWADAGRFYRNSPISYVERVHTPLMIVQGDMDDIVLGQGEEFFSALYRQNKRAAYVRYWGENHGFRSPANILDLWQRMFAWLDEFLQPTNLTKPDSQPSRP